ncbi:putative GDP-fucose protein O-fucosyltransferase [Helianthus annuus]|uniref:O-fucosyltransferase family protein n=2 Tax=Helianthus annuus TaxID=4232 RepID=A0A251UL28_HELAN|nr:O-fucosyltransferase 6 isoform X1 [Helianthus annuus]XP_035830495.1 O-fucosyltransferase 6 isoform X2 [Helianthus annuus]KAF5803962.1 putative GDP-fucose protein O-fucosyltransferase [Helianthus annuus]KAJ0561857.1 putative GDP-fucose protein O-fucosyltransferase [Helianthus annuus]KAJ0574921.1 putative GDP-fucose protein O-fucosyltransferase [Helianthus annuus]KAJ0739251.1 putative GDP-fucose protein O-fucosyltransferase [Helianthus annuus]KAJ0913542.1 putative GDP-fucose protein O-fucosy
MAAHRRRHHHHTYNRFRYLIPAISVTSGAILMLYGFISLLAPSPDHLHHFVRRKSLSEDGVVDDSPAIPSLFKVSVSGEMASDKSLWNTKMSEFYYGCSNASNKFPKVETVTYPNRYLLIATSGGLNQQRTGITDAVVAARILNATLVIPKLDQKSFWKDSSTFSEIFDVDWFITHLSRDVKVIKELPRKGGKDWIPYNMRVPRKCNERCYQIRVLPVLMKKNAVQLSKFDYRLANRLETDLQKLRCRVNYHALKFTDPINRMGQKLVNRMRKLGKHYIALHLRFEPDMLAFSGCYYGGGEKERRELGKIRKRWKTLHSNNPDKERRQGRCPLTPEEVGLMLRALGYNKGVHLYVASGEVYGGDETLAPLRALFPNIHSKDAIATKQELEPFSAFSSRMAALDFIVCDESDVFVTNNNGNMAKILAGRRRYFGHKPTIRPNAKKLYRLFLNRENTTWEEFSSKVRSRQRGFMGEPREVRPGRGEFHENPATCICEDPQAKSKLQTLPRKFGKTDVDSDDVFVDPDVDNEHELSDQDEDDDDLIDPQFQHLVNDTSVDDDPLISDVPEIEELLSD